MNAHFRRTMRSAVLLLVIVFVSSCPSSDGKERESGYTIREGYPRIYLTKEKFGDIKRRCSDKKSSQARYYAILKPFADNYSKDRTELIADDCMVLAFMYAVGKGFEYSIRSIEEYGKSG